jgi:putative heme iron utilization protein
MGRKHIRMIDLSRSEETRIKQESMELQCKIQDLLNEQPDLSTSVIVSALGNSIATTIIQCLVSVRTQEHDNDVIKFFTELGTQIMLNIDELRRRHWETKE